MQTKCTAFCFITFSQNLNKKLNYNSVIYIHKNYETIKNENNKDIFFKAY